MVATTNNHSQIIRPVELHDPNLQLSNELTALKFTCHDGHLDTVELLLMSGADPIAWQGHMD